MSTSEIKSSDYITSPSASAATPSEGGVGVGSENIASSSPATTSSSSSSSTSAPFASSFAKGGGGGGGGSKEKGSDDSLPEWLDELKSDLRNGIRGVELFITNKNKGACNVRGA